MKTIKWHEGMVIDGPCVVSDMPMSVYHGKPAGDDVPSASSSGYRTIWTESEAHYWGWSPYNPEPFDPKPQSEALIKGRAGHHLLLGESKFASQFVIQPEKYPAADLSMKKWNNNADYCKQWKNECASKDLTVLTGEIVRHIYGIRDALKDHPAIQGGILSGAVEQSMFWIDKETGIVERARPDVIPNDLDFADLKITASVSDAAIQRSMRDFRYDMQAAMVDEGCRNLFGEPLRTFTLVMAEGKPPYSVRLIVMTWDDVSIITETGETIKYPSPLKYGRECMILARRRFKRSWDSGYWPGPHSTDAIETFQFAPYVMRGIEREIEQAKQDLAIQTYPEAA